ncbi:MAG: hypothetical protein JO097_00120 [Acidobacteriaceae bacterium]|nr:hypothetical protein [Acidobacteriaceae bacterium]MBV9300882.1 hypothetical protein [Acidobacteriaceae bacterium]
MASAGEKPWLVDAASRVYGLQVIMLKRIYVLPWSQFLYAEGTSEEVRAVFSTHDVVIRGSDLNSLFADFASQQITVLKQPARVDKFTAAVGPRITDLEVQRAE